MTVLSAAALSIVLIVLLRPLLRRYALARPNARSSHREPTPQGGGIAVVAATLVIAMIEPKIGSITVPAAPLALVIAACGLALVGAVDDLRPLPASLRLVLQAMAVTLAVLTAPPGRLLPEEVPLLAERALIVVGGVWFVNLTNFMDGLDWMTVAEFLPVSAALVLFGLFLNLFEVVAVAAALFGALLGFAPFNRPVARLFLGDVGSLPIGLLVGYCLYCLALHGAFAAALILPLYYLADATVTLFRRLSRREKVWQAHRSHFYQQATDNGWPVIAVSGGVFGLNLVLAALALLAFDSAAAGQAGALLLAAILVGLLLLAFTRPPLWRRA